jgi:glycosyltransferase involved in cell wall biosynthesis/2-polyprenyl-3-methyl-5-hydroxy-6-metoxy-1,4-benzoquinol methylase
MINILFVTYHDFTSNSAIQIHNFANSLVKMGNDCCIAVPSNKNSVHDAIGGEILYTPLNFSELQNGRKIFRNGEIPDIIHAWTPREIVRRQCLSLLKMFNCKLVVHLEDNEELLLENSVSIPFDQLKLFSPERLNELVPETASHPIFYKEFLGIADGITIIIDRLVDFVPKNKNYIVLWPGIDKSRFNVDKIDKKLKSKLGINDNNIVLCYTGNVHPSNAREVRSLYLAVALLNREGIPTTLIRTGKDFVSFLGDTSSWAHQYSIELGFVPHQSMSSYLGISDILVQPGRSDRFNEYRLPSKLPEFFIMGKPVILPKANVGLYIQNYEEGLLLEKGDAVDIVNKIKLVAADEVLYQRLSERGHLFALRVFDLEVNTKKLIEFYNALLNIKEKMDIPSDGHKISPQKNDLLVKYYKYPADGLSYSTVRDFCDSRENYTSLCSLNGDLKNVQRPWIVKTILSIFPKGSKLLEIGAGEPKVADFLQKMGYEVTIIDPYEGEGNGPTEFEYFKKRYPHLRIIKNHFESSTDLLINESFDCIYSISVLEHVPECQIPEIFKTIKALLNPDGYSIHCIDHVLMGNGAADHMNKLQIIANENNILPMLDSTINKLSEDVETYFLSAEGHYFWKGQRSYDEFPFRRVVSINLIKKMI